MKKFLMILALVGLFFSCSEMTAEEFAAKENKAWQDYLTFGEEQWAYVNLVGDIPNQYIVELDSANNIIGIKDRELAMEKGRDVFGTAYFMFWMGNKGYFYYDIEEAGNLAVGSLADCVTSYDPAAGSLTVDLNTLLEKPENAGVDIGDEVFKIIFYTDSTKTDLMDTFTFIL